MPPTTNQMEDEATTPTWMKNPLYFFGLKDYRSPTPSPTTIESKIELVTEPGQVAAAPAPVPAPATKSAMKIPDLQVDKRVTPVTPAVHNAHTIQLAQGSGALFPDTKPGPEKGRTSLSVDEAMASAMASAVCVSKHAGKDGGMSPTAIERKFLRQSIASAEVYKSSMPSEMSKSLLQHMEELNNMRIEAFQRYRDTADPVEAQRWGRQYQEISEQILEAQMELCDSSKAVCEFVRDTSGKQAAEEEKPKMPTMGNMAAGPVKHLIVQNKGTTVAEQLSRMESMNETNTTSTSSTYVDSSMDEDDDFEANGLSPTTLERRILRESSCFQEIGQEPLRNGVVHTTALRNGMVCGLEFTHSLSPTAMERKILRNSMSFTDMYQSAKPPRMSAEFMDGVDSLNKKVAKDSALKSIENLSKKRKEAFNKYRESLGNDGDGVAESLKLYREISSEIAGKRRSLLESSLPPAYKPRQSLLRSSPMAGLPKEDISIQEEVEEPLDYVRIGVPPKSKASTPAKSSTPCKGRASGLEAAIKTPVRTPIRTPIRPPSGAKATSGVKKNQLFATPKTINTPSRFTSAEKQKAPDTAEMPSHLSGLQVDTWLWNNEPSKIIPNASTTFLNDPNVSTAFLTDPLAAIADKDKEVVEKSLHPATHALAFKEDSCLDEESAEPECEPANPQGKVFSTPKIVETPSKLPLMEEDSVAPSNISGLQASTLAETELQPEAGSAVPGEKLDIKSDLATPKCGKGSDRKSDKQHIVLKHVEVDGKEHAGSEDKVQLPRNKLGETAEGPVNLERQSMHESPKHATTFNFFDMLSFFKTQLGFEGKKKAEEEEDDDGKPCLRKSWEKPPRKSWLADSAPAPKRDKSWTADAAPPPKKTTSWAPDAVPAPAPAADSAPAVEAIAEAKKAIAEVLADAQAPVEEQEEAVEEFKVSIAATEMEPAVSEPVEAPVVEKEEEKEEAVEEFKVSIAATEMEPAASEPVVEKTEAEPEVFKLFDSQPEEEVKPKVNATPNKLKDVVLSTPSKVKEPVVAPSSANRVKHLASSFGTSTPSKAVNTPNKFALPGSASKVKDMASSFGQKDDEAAASMKPGTKHFANNDPAANPGAVFGMKLKSTPKKDIASRGKGNEEIRLTNMSEKVRAVATSFKLQQMAAEESDRTPSKPPLGRSTPLKPTPGRCASGGNENTRMTNLSNHVREAANNFKEKAFAATHTPSKDPSHCSTATPKKVKDLLAAFNTPQKGATPLKAQNGTPAAATTPSVLKLKAVSSPKAATEGSPATTPVVLKAKPVSVQPAEEGTPSKVKDFVNKVQTEAEKPAVPTPSKVKAFINKVEKIPGGSASRDNTQSKVRDFASTFTAKIDEQKETTPHKSVISASPFKKFEAKQGKTPVKRALDSDSEAASPAVEDPTDPRSRKKEWKRADVFAGVKDAANEFKERDAADQAAEEANSKPSATKKARQTFQDKIKKAASGVDRTGLSTPEKTVVTRAPATTSKLMEADKENMANSPKAAPKSASKLSSWSRDKAVNSAKKKELEKGWHVKGESEEEAALRKEALAETEQMLEEEGEGGGVGQTKVWLANNREEHQRVPPGLGIGFRV